jgi:hypothetical protein
MQVRWRERDFEALRDEISGDQVLRGQLATYGLLKFLENPLMRGSARLLSQIIEYWNVDDEVFIVHGEQIELTLIDIYFLTGLPIYGVVGDILPMLPRGLSLKEFIDRHCTRGSQVHDGLISIRDIARLETRAVATAIVRILGSHAPHRVFGVQMMIVERVLEGTYF